MKLDFQSWIPIAPTTRPSSFTPQADKDNDDAYDVQRARWCIASIDQEAINSYMREYAANAAMVQNNAGAASWGSTDIIREFLGDETNPTGRLAFKFPMMQPVHTRMVASIATVGITPKATAWTSNVIARKDAALSERLMYAQAAAMGGPLGDAVMNNTGASPDPEQEERFFDATWTDPYERAMTNLLLAAHKHQGLDYLKWKIASNIALSGVGAVAMFPQSNRIEAMVCEPQDVLWDPAATKADYTDGAFVGWRPLMDVEAIAEEYQPKANVIKGLDNWARQSPAGYNTQSGWPTRRPRVFKIYFRDIRTVERGFVMEDGEITFATINRPDPSLPNMAPKWTDKDLVIPPVNDFTNTWTAAEKAARKIRRMVQVLRYCDFIPWEYLPGAVTQNMKADSKEAQMRREELAKTGISFTGSCGDVVLAHGEYDYQEKDPDDVFGVEFPIKFSTWMYIAGRPIAPLSCVRDIGSVMNAVMSDIMRRMSRADMPTTVFDEAALAGANITQNEAAKNLKNGKAFGIKAQLAGGVPQSVMQTATGLGAEFYNHFRIVDTLYVYTQNLTGVYDQNFGAPGQDQLVRVKELQNRQSGLMLSPLLFAAEHLFLQIHRFNGGPGKLFYGGRPWLLNAMVGDEGDMVILSSKDLMNEQFRVEVVLSQSPQQEREDARQMILAQGGYLDRQMLDTQEATALLARGANIKDVDDAAARFTKRLAEAQAMQAEAMQREQQGMIAQETKNKLDEREDDLAVKAAQVEAQMATAAQRAQPVSPAKESRPLS